MIWGGCLSLPGCTVSVLATEDVSPGQDSHLLTMDVLSPAREGGLPEAGRVTAWELGAHSPPLAEAQHQLSHSPAQVGMANTASTQGSPKGLGDPAGLTWGTAGKVAGEPLTAPPAPCHTGWDGSRGTMALLFQLPKPLWDHPPGPGVFPHAHLLTSSDPQGQACLGLSKPCKKQPRNPELQLLATPSHTAACSLWPGLAAGWIKTWAPMLL